MSKNLLNLLLLVASFALYYVVLNPLYTGFGSVWQPEQGITSLRSLNAQYTDTLSQAQSLLSQADALKRQYNSISDESKVKMEMMVPDTVDPVRLVSEVNSIANQTGVTLQGLGYSKITPVNNGPGSYQIGFNVKTDYDTFKELMYNYETSLRLFTIKSISFAAPDKDSGLTTYQVRLETYYLK